MLHSKIKRKTITELEALLCERISQAIFTLFNIVVPAAEIAVVASMHIPCTRNWLRPACIAL